MSLMRWDPVTELNSIRHLMNRFFESPWLRWRTEGYGPRVDVYQTDEEVVATAELPGIETKEDIDITVTENSLTIKGEFRRGQELREENFYHSERYYGNFSRTVPLPVEVKPEETRAAYKNGILEVRMPKSEQARKKPVKINIH